MSAANESSLGNTTKLGSALPKQGEIEEFANRYSYVAVRFYMQAVSRKLLPNERVQICWRYPLPARKAVDVIYSDERERARASGTMKCGSAWVCPICSQYIAERRRAELGQALLNAREHFVAVMITYTVQHNPGMRLAGLLDAMQKAFRRVKTGRAWVDIKQEFALVGSVRATEITHGASGWHPHYHELMFVDINHIREYFEGEIAEYAEGLEAVLCKRWLVALASAGLSASEEIGLRISTTNDDVAEYIAKYGKLPLESDFKGMSSEITYGSKKSAKQDNIGALELLFFAERDRESERLFLEYAHAVKGRSQLQWSRGLKALLGIDEIRDEQAAEGIETETDRLLASVPIELWRFMADRGYMGQMMTRAHTGDQARVQHFLTLLQVEYESHFGPLPQFDLGH